jgi:hypothetical protein
MSVRRENGAPMKSASAPVCRCVSKILANGLTNENVTEGRLPDEACALLAMVGAGAQLKGVIGGRVDALLK